MENLGKSLKAKIVSSAVTIGGIGAVIAFAVSSFSWFHVNKKVTSSGMKTQIFADINLVDFDFMLYKYDFDLKEGVGFSEEDFDLGLNKFDNYIRERNINNNNIIRLNATLPHSKASGEGDREIFVNVNCSESEVGSNYDAHVTERTPVNRTHSDENGFKYDANSHTYYCNNTSNVIQFKCFVSEYVVDGVKTVLTPELDETNADTTYKTATNIFKGMEDAEKSFIEDSVKDDNIVVSSNKIPSIVSNFVLYIEYNYNEALVDEFLRNTEFFSSSGQGTQILEGNMIGFNKDIEQIRISSTAGE